MVDAKEAAVLVRRLMSRLARDSRYPFACPREVREAIESIRFCVDLIGLYIGQKRVATAEQAAARREAADDPVKIRSVITNLLGGGYLAHDELTAHDLGLWPEQLMAFGQHDDRTAPKVVERHPSRPDPAAGRVGGRGPSQPESPTCRRELQAETGSRVCEISQPGLRPRPMLSRRAASGESRLTSAWIAEWLLKIDVDLWLPP